MSATAVNFSPEHPDVDRDRLPDFDVATVPDEADDKPDVNGKALLQSSKIGDWPALFLGCATFSGIYSSRETFESSIPLRIVRLALRYGINAFDTSPSYHPSEIILGKALYALRGEFPRETYKIVTKAGKYGSRQVDHDLNPELTRKCVERSLERFKTDYLDTVYLHDIEFTAELKPAAGFHLAALTTSAEKYGLAPDQAGKIWGPGDQKVLDSVRVLHQLKEQGRIRNIGVAGYPLPVLLRICRLCKHNGVPLDMIQSYSHHNLQNSTLDAFLPHFEEAGVKVIANASPLNMGLLTTNGAPDWHFARTQPELIEGVQKVREMAEREGVKIEDLAISFGMRDLSRPLPVVVGCNTMQQIHIAVASLRESKTPSDQNRDEKLRDLSIAARDLIKQSGFLDWDWEEKH